MYNDEIATKIEKQLVHMMKYELSDEVNDYLDDNEIKQSILEMLDVIVDDVLSDYKITSQN